MFSKIVSKTTATAITGLFVVTLGLGIVTGGGAASAQQNETPSEEGSAGQCTYAGLTYSEGSKVKQADGNIYRCMADGTWVLSFKAPPVRLRGNFTNVGVFQAN